MEQPNTITTKGLRKYFNIIGLAFIVMILLCAGIYHAYYYGLENYGFYLEGYDMTTVNLGLDMLCRFTVLFVPFFLFRFPLNVGFRDIFHRTGHSIRGIFSFFCSGIAAYLILTFFTTTLYTTINPAWIDGTIINADFQTSNLIMQSVYVGYFVLFIPLVEEYVFRGVILRTSSRAGGFFGIAVSSLLYVLYCFGRSEILLSLGISVFLCALSMVYHSIWPSFFAHVGVNAIILYGLFVPKDLSWILGLIAVVVYSFAIYAMYRNRNRKLVWRTNVPTRVAAGCFVTSPLMLFAILLLIFRSVYYIMV